MQLNHMTGKMGSGIAKEEVAERALEWKTKATYNLQNAYILMCVISH